MTFIKWLGVAGIVAWTMIMLGIVFNILAVIQFGAVIVIILAATGSIYIIKEKL